MSPAVSDPEAIHVASGGLSELPSIGPLSTKTVLGFLDFVTTVSDTVIKFTSQGGNPHFLKPVCLFFTYNWYFRRIINGAPPKSLVLFIPIAFKQKFFSHKIFVQCMYIYVCFLKWFMLMTDWETGLHLNEWVT